MLYLSIAVSFSRCKSAKVPNRALMRLYIPVSSPVPPHPTRCRIIGMWSESAAMALMYSKVSLKLTWCVSV